MKNKNTTTKMSYKTRIWWQMQLLSPSIICE